MYQFPPFSTFFLICNSLKLFAGFDKGYFLKSMYILIPITDAITPTRHATNNIMPIDSVFVSNIVN